MSEPALHSKKPWRAVLARRRWRSGYNAGGGPNYMGEISDNAMGKKERNQDWRDYKRQGLLEMCEMIIA